MIYGYELAFPPYIANLASPLLDGAYDLTPFTTERGTCVAMRETTRLGQHLTILSQLAAGPIIIEQHALVDRDRHSDVYELEGDGKVVFSSAAKHVVCLADPGYDDGWAAHRLRGAMYDTVFKLTLADVVDDALAFQERGVDMVVGGMALDAAVSPVLAGAARLRHADDWTTRPGARILTSIY